jgi:protein dithiol oxidoreductase (disulfide-forming)
MKRLLLALGLVAALAGCSQKVVAPATPAPEESAASTPPADTPAPPAAADAEDSAAAAELPPPAVASDSITAKPLEGNWKAGKNYLLVSPSQPTSVDPGQVEIIEFMWLGCPHCYELNPYIEAWRRKLPAYVKFRQEHVTWDAQRLPHARLFYTLRALGRLDDLVVKAFDEIHRKGNPLMASSPAATEQLQLEFAVANGIKAEDFEREYNGFAVNTSLKRADDLVRRYRVDQVPTIIVNGKYRTDVAMAGSPEKLTQLLNDLAASEKAR